MLMSLLVQEEFGPTVQGVGYWSGTVVSFIRLYGCPLACPWCDTGYADGGKSLHRTHRSIPELVGSASQRVVISGGEPFVQQELPLLVDALIQSGKNVHIETSGAIHRSVHPDAWITLSPKQHVSPRYPVRPEFWQRCNEIKIVIEDGNEVDFYRHYIAQSSAPVFLQPQHTADDSIQVTLDLLYSNPSYRLSLQTHKMIGVQ